VIDLLCKIFANNENHDALIPLAFAGLSAIKHPGFRQEREWSLVKAIPTIFTNGDSGVKFREGRGGIVPYVHAEVYARRGEFSPDAITIGPNDDAAAAKSALESFLATKGLFGFLIRERVKISSSKTPYRP
jgi:hypothetical protein